MRLAHAQTYLYIATGVIDIGVSLRVVAMELSRVVEHGTASELIQKQCM